MKSSLEIDTSSPEDVKEVIEPSLDDSRQVKHEIISVKNKVKLEAETETLGQLRGATDGVFRLSSLAKKIIEQ
ncbi:MAG: KEOPS complex subunit Pcc1 [Candidatus Nanosalina sp.]